MKNRLAKQIEKILKEHECENYVLLVKDPDNGDDHERWGNELWAEGAMRRSLRVIDVRQRDALGVWVDGEDGEEVNAKD